MWLSTKMSTISMVGVRWSKYYTSLDMTSLRVWLSLPIQAPAKLKVRAFTSWLMSVVIIVGWLDAKVILWEKLISAAFNNRLMTGRNIKIGMKFFSFSQVLQVLCSAWTVSHYKKLIFPRMRPGIKYQSSWCRIGDRRGCWKRSSHWYIRSSYNSNSWTRHCQIDLALWLK